MKPDTNLASLYDLIFVKCSISGTNDTYSYNQVQRQTSLNNWHKAYAIVKSADQKWKLLILFRKYDNSLVIILVCNERDAY